MRLTPSIGRTSMASVLAAAVIIDTSDLLRTKLSALVVLMFLLAFVFETLVQSIGHWLKTDNRESLNEDLRANETAKGPLPPVQPEVPDAAEAPAPDEPTPSISAPPTPEPDWERLSREPAYKRKHAVLTPNRHQRVSAGERLEHALQAAEPSAAAAN